MVKGKEMNKEKLMELIRENGLETKIRDLSFCVDESQQNSYELVLTVWKDGRVTLELVQRGSYYSDEVDKTIDERIILARNLVYDNYDVQAAVESGISDDDIPDDAIGLYKNNFDIKEYIDSVYLNEAGF